MSSKLDAQLADAAGLHDEVYRPPEQPELETPPAGGERKRHIGLLVALLAVVVATVALFLFGFKEAAIYAIGVDELGRRQEELVGRVVRIDGELVPGTLVRRERPCEVRFRLQKAGAEVAVHYAQCVVPENLRDRPEGGVMVTVEGSLTAANAHFQATNVQAKCSSRYDPRTRTMSPSQ